jgi:diacylglycerol kinase family enzyme
VQELVREARRQGIDCHVLGEADDPAVIAREAEAGVLGVAGGDGSLASIASVALERDVPFVCVPFGTRNHFARDLGLDGDAPLAALESFDGSERRIDVGRVNGRLFLNNVSLGVYAGLVHRRERHRRRGEALAGLRAVASLIRGGHRLGARIGGRSVRVRILLIANNSYELSLFTLGERRALDEGNLHVYGASGWLPGNWLELVGPDFRIELDTPGIRAAVDGEPLRLESSLDVRCFPKALRVLAPAEARAARMPAPARWCG